jgi:uncharacterized OB-fold protein
MTAAAASTSPPATPTKPIKPTITELNRPFWDGCRARRLLAQRCTNCGELRYPISAICPNCLAKTTEWQELSGRGELFSFIVIHRGYHPYWAERIPYNVAFVELEEGLRMFSNIVGTPNERLCVGQKVKVAFEQRDEDLVVPVFEIVKD